MTGVVSGETDWLSDLFVVCRDSSHPASPHGPFRLGGVVLVPVTSPQFRQDPSLCSHARSQVPGPSKEATHSRRAGFSRGSA